MRSLVPNISLPIRQCGVYTDLDVSSREENFGKSTERISKEEG
jgi:hypothetical protein